MAARRETAVRAPAAAPVTAVRRRAARAALQTAARAPMEDRVEPAVGKQRAAPAELAGTTPVCSAAARTRTCKASGASATSEAAIAQVRSTRASVGPLPTLVAAGRRFAVTASPVAASTARGSIQSSARRGRAIPDSAYVQTAARSMRVTRPQLPTPAARLASRPCACRTDRPVLPVARRALEVA
jgi:hypothetical protein